MAKKNPNLPTENAQFTPPNASGKRKVLVEVRVSKGQSFGNLEGLAQALNLGPLTVDPNYIPVPMTPANNEFAARLEAANEETVIISGTVNEYDLQALEENPSVIKVWSDAIIEPFGAPTAEAETEEETTPQVVPMEAFGTCPIPPCDCDPRTPKGSMADVRRYLGVDQLHTRGIRGNGVVVGVLDSGITAAGRTLKPSERPTSLIPNVIGGWPADWGTESSDWGYHGNMCATDVLGMAPDARIYDLRISDSGSSTGSVGAALQAFQWAINQYRANGTPQVLTNSWGMFQEGWFADYTRNPEHPFTRKVVEAINAGILVLFAAGNCGGTCPDGRCGSENGPGKSIWGANGHPFVMTVGAVNSLGQFIGYSSQGPAALDPFKPDFCSISHFTGYFASDSGTSAATPIAAGVVALLKQAKPRLTQFEAKAALKETARNIGPAGWDQHSGSGIINGLEAYNLIMRAAPTPQTPRVGVQFRGNLEPRQTMCWFTFNWPAHWHIYWYGMPITPGTKISWKVQVERATEQYITYWICVTNLSDRATTFEGRYAVLS